MKRGDVYFVKAGSTNNSGYTIWTGRPAVVVSDNAINQSEHVVEIVFLTSAPKKDSEFHVQFQCRDRMATALCEQVTTLDASQLTEYVTHVSEDDMVRISEAVARSLGLTNVVCSDTKPTFNAKAMESEVEHWKGLYVQQLKITSELLEFYNDR